MQTRIDELCALAALKTTRAIDISNRLHEEKNDVNGYHSKDRTRAIEFAAQSGNLEVLRSLIEDYGASVNADEQVLPMNLLQWSHDLRADPEIRQYITDPDRKLWRHFKDGTDDLHIYAYKGMVDAVKEIFALQPERICELANSYFSPLYWANLGNQKPMQEFLLQQLDIYRNQHADNDEKMQPYHIGLLFAATQQLQAYSPINALLALRTRIPYGNVKQRQRLTSALQGYVQYVIQTLGQRLLHFANTGKWERLKFAKQQCFKHCHAILDQTVHAAQLISTHNDVDNLVLGGALVISMDYYALASESYLELLNIEMTLPEKNTAVIESYLNDAHADAELGQLQTDKFPKSLLSNDISTRKEALIKKLKETKIAVERAEKEIQSENTEINIKRDPLKQLFQMLQKKDCRVVDIRNYIAANNINISQFYRFRAAIDHAVLYAPMSVARDLIENNRHALAIPDNSKRKNLMESICGKTVSTDISSYLLDPQRRLWECFQDGTTDLHAHALAGRINEVLAILSATPERFLEVNRHGYNVLYWAFHSEMHDTFKDELRGPLEAFQLYLTVEKRWSDLMKHYQNCHRFVNECLAVDDRVLLYLQNVMWFNELKINDDTPEFIALKDYLNLSLANAYMEQTPSYTYILQLNCAREFLKEVINPALRLELEEELAHQTVLYYIKESTQHRIEGEHNLLNNSIRAAIVNFKRAQESFQKARSHLQDWTTDGLVKKKFLARELENFSQLVQSKIELAEEFLPFTEEIKDEKLSHHQDIRALSRQAGEILSTYRSVPIGENPGSTHVSFSLFRNTIAANDNEEKKQTDEKQQEEKLSLSAARR